MPYYVFYAKDVDAGLPEGITEEIAEKIGGPYTWATC